MQDINTVVITGNLTRDPELQRTPGGVAVAALRVAVNGGRKQGDQWVDEANFFDIVVFGARAEAAAKYLAKGSKVGVDGRLDYQEWDAKDGSGKRSRVKVIANQVQFLGRKPVEADEKTSSQSDFAAEGAEEEIPF